MSKCKCCHSTLRDDIDAMLLKGAGSTYLSQWLDSRGLSVSPAAISNHAKRHIEGYTTAKAEVRKAEDIPIDSIEPEVTIVNFEKYCNEIGLNPLEFEDVDNIVGATQKAISTLFFKTSAIVNAKIDDHIKGKCRYPTAQTRSLKALFELHSKAIGLEHIVNHNKALETLERLGYRIERAIEAEAKSIY